MYRAKMEKAIAEAMDDARDDDMKVLYATDFWLEDGELELEDDSNSENVDVDQYAVDGVDKHKGNTDQASTATVSIATAIVTSDGQRDMTLRFWFDRSDKGQN